MLFSNISLFDSRRSLLERLKSNEPIFNYRVSRHILNSLLYEKVPKFDFQNQFSMSKNPFKSFSISYVHIFCYWHFLIRSFLIFFTKMMPYFGQLAINQKLKTQNSIIFFGYVDFYAKIFLILYPLSRNSITGNAIVCICRI